MHMEIGLEVGNSTGSKGRKCLEVLYSVNIDSSAAVPLRYHTFSQENDTPVNIFMADLRNYPITHLIQSKSLCISFCCESKIVPHNQVQT